VVENVVELVGIGAPSTLKTGE